MATSTAFDYGCSRQLRAIETHKPVDFRKSAFAKAAEAWTARHLGATRYKPREPLDCLLDNIGIEVKTLVDNPRGNITIHPSALKRKFQFAKEKDLKGLALVVLDFRKSERPTLYFRKNLGSFSINTLTRAQSWEELKRGLLDETMRTDSNQKAQRPGGLSRAADLY